MMLVNDGWMERRFARYAGSFDSVGERVWDSRGR